MKMVCFCEKVHFRFIYTPSFSPTTGEQHPTKKTKV